MAVENLSGVNEVRQWATVRRKVDSLVPYEKNPRKISPENLERLKKKILRNGFHGGVKATKDGLIIGGHQRIKILRELGVDEIDVITAPDDLTDAQYREALLSDNVSDGEFDAGLLQEFTMAELEFAGVPDFSMALPPKAGKTDDDYVPEASVPVSASGDVWLLGAHRVMCGSATVQPNVDALMAGKRSDMLLTDPPYNVAYEGKTKNALKIKNDNMGDSDFRQFLRDAFASADSVMRPGASFYIWHADSEGYNFRGACRDVGWKVRQCLIWLKSQIVMGRQDYHWKHEPCLYGWKDGASHCWASDRKQSTVIECNKPSRSEEHPTMKPVELVEYQLCNNTRAGDIVLDLFGGSGSTLIAAEKTGRVCYMMELDPKYCDVIVRRWQKYTGLAAVSEATGLAFGE